MDDNIGDDDDDDENDDNDSDNESSIDNNGYNDNYSIISSYKLQNSSDSMRKSAATLQIQSNSGRLLSTYSPQGSPFGDSNYAYTEDLQQKGVHVDNDSDYNDRNSDNHGVVVLLFTARCMFSVIGWLYLL